MNGFKGKAAIALAALAIALPLIPKYEGTVLPAYRDPVGIPTICSGHTKNVKMGDIATLDLCKKYTEEDLNDAWKVFDNAIPDAVIESMSPESVAAFLDFILNVGPGKRGVKDGFIFLKNGSRSTMYRKLVAGDIRGACLQFRYWLRPPLKGIKIRREHEEKLCLSGLK